MLISNFLQVWESYLPTLNISNVSSKWPLMMTFSLGMLSKKWPYRIFVPDFSAENCPRPSSSSWSHCRYHTLVRGTIIGKEQGPVFEGSQLILISRVKVWYPRRLTVRLYTPLGRVAVVVPYSLDVCTWFPFKRITVVALSPRFRPFWLSWMSTDTLVPSLTGAFWG